MEERNRFAAFTADREQVSHLDPEKIHENSQLHEIVSEVKSSFPIEGYEIAQPFLEELIIRQRFSSQNWVGLAESAFWLGDQEAARAWLDISDQLDPGYISQLLTSLPVWVLMGDEEKPIEIFKRISEIDPDSVDEAVVSMIRSGIPFLYFSPFIPWESCSSPTRVSIIASVASNLPRRFSLISDRIFEYEYNKKEKISLLRSSITAGDGVSATALYHDVQFDDAQVSFLNSGLERNPLQLTPIDVLGWQPLHGDLRRIASWKESWRNREGVLDLEFDSSEIEYGSNINWSSFYILSDSDSPFVAELNIFLSGSENHSVGFEVRRKKDRSLLERVTPGNRSQEWQTIRVGPLDLQNDEILELRWVVKVADEKLPRDALRFVIDDIDFLSGVSGAYSSGLKATKPSDG